MTVTTFFFVAGHPALDFVNTEAVAGGQPVDLLASEDDLLRWLSESGLATSDEPRKPWLRQAKELRASLRRLFLRLAEGKKLRGSDLAGIDDALATVEGTPHLDLQAGQPRLQFRPSRAATPPFLIARAAAEFLATADLSLIRRCEGSDCVLFFYDTTKSHTRRWCSMAGCGNRAKAAAHYSRVRKQQG
ncbi:MAG TPA: ABATE domain-containing protein [Thermoanaerobaculia bacterium]|nr:ABATE domain-containing protein [Thermoanaerobaculia bacterium]